MGWRWKYPWARRIASWNSSCGRLSEKARAEVTHCYAHSAPWFLIKWNCIGTRCAFKPRPDRIHSPPPLSSRARVMQFKQFYDPLNAITGPVSVLGVFLSVMYVVCRLSLCLDCLHILSLCHTQAYSVIWWCIYWRWLGVVHGKY